MFSWVKLSIAAILVLTLMVFFKTIRRNGQLIKEVEHSQQINKRWSNHVNELYKERITLDLYDKDLYNNVLSVHNDYAISQHKLNEKRTRSEDSNKMANNHISGIVFISMCEQDLVDSSAQTECINTK